MSKSEVAAVAPALPEAAEKQRHRLESNIQSHPKQGVTWGTCPREIYTSKTVEEFWWYALINPQNCA